MAYVANIRLPDTPVKGMQVRRRPLLNCLGRPVLLVKTNPFCVASPVLCF